MDTKAIYDVLGDMRARRVNHGKHTSPTLEAWADTIEQALKRNPGAATPTEYRCPQCGKWMEVPLGMISNCQRYFSSPVMRTRCCGYGVRIVPHFYIELEAMPRDTKQDSLGIALNRDQE